jgi:alkyl sulfatase BDS1-like metallo-beta-lactamase superfamily hydrolase
MDQNSDKTPDAIRPGFLNNTYHLQTFTSMKKRINLVLALAGILLATACQSNKDGQPNAETTKNGKPERPEKYYVPFSAPQNFIDHAQYFKEEVVKIGSYKIWSVNTPGGGIGNFGVLEGENGLVIIDVGTGTEFAKRAQELIQQITTKPVLAIVYTHHHVDHTAGANVFVKPEDAASGKVKVIAAENFEREAALENAAVGPIMGLRAAYMYGLPLPKDAEGKHYHIGCCGDIIVGTNGFIRPNTPVPLQGITEMKIDGYRIQFFHTGGESASHIGVYLPDQKIVFTGDEIQGPTFPQLHSLRGTRPRDVERWFSAIDRIRDFDIEYLVPGHGQVMTGASSIQEMLQDYRDRMQYVLDQSIRLINQGNTPDELAEKITMPKNLQTEPFGMEYYGNVDVSARNVYGGLISWWNGDPATLRPTPRIEKAKREIAMMGGRDKVFAEAEKAFLAGDAQWTAELTTPLIRVDTSDWQARYLKAAALRVLGYRQTSSSLRGFYLSGALEIEGKIDPLALQRQVTSQVLDPTTLQSIGLFTLFRYRINPERANGKTIRLGYNFTDTKENFTLTLRNGILEIVPRRNEKSNAQITMTRQQFNQVFMGTLSYEQAVGQGAVITGDKNAIQNFFAVIDQPSEQARPHTALK